VAIRGSLYSGGMRYEGDVYRPPSEADAYILQATIGCSWNACTYCDMYRAKRFRVRPLEDNLKDLAVAAERFGDRIRKVFVADGDALAMGLDDWLPVLDAAARSFPKLKRVSAYATARNLLEKTPSDLRRLREAGLRMLYIGPESGDDPTLKAIAKGASFDQHVEAARRAHDAELRLSAIFLLGAGGTERSEAHARESARLATAMDPRFLSVLTLTVQPGTPIARLAERGRFVLPDVGGLLDELRRFLADVNPTDAVFRTNHASNWLPLAGRLPRDRAKLLDLLDRARDGELPLTPSWARGL